MSNRITGRSAEEIASSVRALIDEGALSPGDMLPPIRRLAETLGVNRNTALAAYHVLIRAGLAESHGGRKGTVVADPIVQIPEEGYAQNSVLRDIGAGNPDPAFLPDPTEITLDKAPIRLYGGPAIDPDLAEWATHWLERAQPRPFRLTVTAGAVEAVERLLAQALVPGDLVAVEDPCFLTSISTIRHGGYRALPVEMDAEGMLPASLRAALNAGVRAVVCTPRAHNPTGVSLTAERAAELREVLTSSPQVMIIEDDHFALLSQCPYATVIPAEHRRWALVRSVSKALGPDMRVALVASDFETAEKLALRISGGITWVSHLLQRITYAMLTDRGLLDRLRAAGEHYRSRNAAFVRELRAVGLDSDSHDGLNVWVNTGADTDHVHRQLMQLGWLAREGHLFGLDGGHRNHLRVTVHQLDDANLGPLARDIATACQAARPTPPVRHQTIQ